MDNCISLDNDQYKMLHVEQELPTYVEIPQATFQSEDKEEEAPGMNLNNNDFKKISIRNDIFQPIIALHDYSVNKVLTDKEKKDKDKFPVKKKCGQCYRWIKYKSSWDVHSRFCKGQKSSVPIEGDTNEVAKLSE